MFEILPQSTDKTLVCHMSGEITGPEYQQFTDALQQRFDKGAEVDLVLDLSGVKFYADFEAMKKDFEFSTGGYKKLRRCALVGEEKWLKNINKLFGAFTHTKEKHFPEGKLQEAIDWANG